MRRRRANGNVKLGRAAARSGEWAQHFSNASCSYHVGRYQSNLARDVLDTILSIQPKDSGGGGETRESVVYRLAEEFLGKMPRNYVDFEVNSAQLNHCSVL